MKKLITKKVIEMFLDEIGTKKIKHIKRKSLFDHLLRTADILEAWKSEDYLIYAGMCHSLYSTEIFEEEIISSLERKKLQEIIGEKAENLVYLFSRLKRTTLQQNSDETFYFSDRISGEKTLISFQEGKDIVTLLLANEIDHLNAFSVMQSGSIYQYISPFVSILDNEPKKMLRSLLDGRQNIKDDEYVRFIAHSGVHIKTKGISIAIDPWLYSSSHEHALIQGFDPESTTVDFIVPDPRNTITDIASDIILLSHFHTHHSPYYEIYSLIKMKETVDIICPTLSDSKLRILQTWLKDDFKKITFHFLEKNTDITIRGVSIKCLTHNNPEHFAYFIKTPSCSVMHIVDAAVRTKDTQGEFGEYWNNYDNLNPDFLFIGAAGHALRNIDALGKKQIIESTSLTPIQAAKVTQRIGAKNVATAGVFNFSIWDARVEYVLPYEFVESQFYWAMSFLEPSVNVHQLRPGDTFRKGENGHWYKGR